MLYLSDVDNPTQKAPPVAAGPPSRPGSRLTVATVEHISAHYHLLAHFDLGRDPVNAFNAFYVGRVQARRGKASPPPTRHFGRFHTAFRASAGRVALTTLPLCATTAPDYLAILDSLEQGAPPADLTPGLRRALSPLADDRGRVLVRLLRELLIDEGSAFWTAHWLSGASLSGDEATGMESYLNEHLVPLVRSLYGALPQVIRVFPSEAVGARSWSLVPDVGEHRVVVAPVLKTAYFQVLLALVRNRTDRLIRPFLPEDLKRPEHVLGLQMRNDAALTVVHHLLSRQRSERMHEFRAWALRQFENTQRLPAAALEALQPMALVPPEAHAAIEALLDGTGPA